MMPIDAGKLDRRTGQASSLLAYLPAIFQDSGGTSDAALLARFLMAFESILLGLSKSRPAEFADLQWQPGLEEILGGSLQGGASNKLLDGIQRYFDPGPDYPADPQRIADYNRAPPEFLAWLAGWVSLTL